MTRPFQSPRSALLRAMIVAALCVPAPSASQERTRPILNLPTGFRVRVLAVDSTVIWGHLEDRLEAGIVLFTAYDAEPITLPHDQILGMWRREGTYATHGGILGGALGMAIGYQNVRSQRAAGYVRELEALEWIVGGLVGAGSGALFGGLLKRWVPLPR